MNEEAVKLPEKCPECGSKRMGVQEGVGYYICGSSLRAGGDLMQTKGCVEKAHRDPEA